MHRLDNHNNDIEKGMTALKAELGWATALRFNGNKKFLLPASFIVKRAEDHSFRPGQSQWETMHNNRDHLDSLQASPTSFHLQA